MDNFNSILLKLNAYIKKYYTKQLIKGILLFISLGLLFFLLVTGVEYLLWLGSSVRLVLLLVLAVGLLLLAYQYIAIPLLYLFRVKKGITNRRASELIGKHFANVGDRLVNLLDLSGNTEQSDLLVAAIEQRSNALKDVPFVNAISFKESWAYSKYVLIPAAIVVLLIISGRISDFIGSYKRVVNYDIAYAPPAPFAYQLLNNTLKVLENESLTLELETIGNSRPENVSLVLDGTPLVMQEREGRFFYKMEAPLESGSFYFTANGFDSRTYDIEVGSIPVISSFEMRLEYPSYLGKQNKSVKGTGNATVPEGTKVVWNITGVHTDKVDFVAKDTVITFFKEGDSFSHDKRFYSSTEYALTTSNVNVNEFENLGYGITVIKDAYPTIKVERVMDSLNPNTSYFTGLATDDIKVKKVSLFYYPVRSKKEIKELTLLKTDTNVEQFYYTFPSGLDIEEGATYELYFEVKDNDGLRKGKVTKSQVFRNTILGDKELKNKELESQQSILRNLDDSLEELKEQKEALEEINKQQKERTSLNFNEKNDIKQFLEKQELQESLMEKFSKQLNESLEKNESDEELKKLLQERLERQELEAAKNKKLLEELNKIADKIDQDDLKKRLEELGKKQSNSERNLEQLLELTKRFYVTEKASQLAKELNELSKKQEALADKELDELEKKLQQELNESYKELAKELEELQKDNKDLKKPLDLDIDENKKEGVKKDQEEALEELNKQQGEEESSKEGQESNKDNAKKKQKSAAQKMKELSESLEQGASGGGGGSSITEDAEMLRQILDNLITFSFKQEKLFDEIEGSEGRISQFSSTVRKQKELRGLFEHVDDSLFALSLRRVELSEVVNENITEVYYNIDKSLESIADNQLYQGASHQQYVLNAGNTLADFLANLLDNMQQSMQSGKGQGEGDGFQLPDIIKGQQELGEKMQNGGKPGQKGKEGQEGEKGNKGEKGKDGDSGKEGQGGEKGQGKNGEGGQGKNGQKGEGSEGKNGEGSQNGKEGKGSKGKNGKGDGGKSDGGSSGGKGQGPSEEELKEIYEIYKEQQAIRQQLEDQLKNIIQNDKRDLAKKLVRQMESFENDLLENGITQRTVNKMNSIQHQLLKLENAALKQGEKKERESKTNLGQFQNPILTKPELLNRKNNSIEILNRQALPLRQNYQSRVKNYFKSDN